MWQALKDLLGTDEGANLLRRFVLAHERQAAALTRLAELQEVELGLDAPTLARAAAPIPDDAVRVSNPEVDQRLAAEFTRVAEQLERTLHRVPTPEEVLEEHERLAGSGVI